MKTVLLAAIATLGVTTGAADAAIYTNRAAFLAATTGAITEMFTAPVNGYVLANEVYSGTDFQLVSASYDAVIFDPGYDYNFQWNSGAVYSPGAFSKVQLVTTANAIGFDFGNADSAASVFTINGVSYGGFAIPHLAFFGITGSGPVGTVTIEGHYSQSVLDNITTAVTATVPEPATWATLIGGFAMTGTALRRRRTATARVTA